MFLKRLPPKLFYEWMAYSLLEPFDETRQDIRTGQLAKALAELHRTVLIFAGAKGVSKEPYKLEDFVLPFGEQEYKPKIRQTWQEKKGIASLIVAAANKMQKAKVIGRDT